MENSIYVKLQELTESLLTNAGIDCMLEIIEKTIERPSIVIDMSFRIISESPLAVDVPEYHYQYQDILFLDERSIELIRTHYIYKKMRDRDYLNTIIPHPTLNTFLVASIKASTADVLMLIIFQNEKPFDSCDLVLIKNICQILSVEFQKENSSIQYRLAIPNHIISSLVSGKNIPRDEVLHKLSYIAWVSAKELYIMLIADYDNSDLGTRISPILNALKAFIPTENCLAYESNILVFLTTEMYQFLHEDKQVELTNFLSQNRLISVTSLGFSDVTDCRYYYIMAKNALPTAKKHEIYLASFQNLTYYILADSLEKNFHIKDFCNPAIVRLLKYDYENNTELYSTLDCYLKNKDNPDLASGKLFIHRSTLFYRIKKIRELIDINTERVGELSSLYMTMRLIGIYGKENMMNDIFKMDASIYMAHEKSTCKREYSDKISYCNNCYLFKFFKDLDFIPNILSAEDGVIVTPLLSGESLYDILGRYDSGRFSANKLIDIFTELFNQLQTIDQRLIKQFDDYILLDFDLLDSIKVSDHNKPIFTTLECITYGEKYDNMTTVIAQANMYTFTNSKKKLWLIDTLMENYSKALAISQKTLENLVSRKTEYISRQLNVRKKMVRTTAVMLCGGKASRMNAVPKIALKIGNFTFFEHLAHTLLCFDDLLISHNEQVKGYSVINDIHVGIGPIGGIYAALSSTKNPHLFVTACDTPNLSRQFIQYLFEQIKAEDDCLIPIINGHSHPLCAIYRKDILPVMENQINSGKYKLSQLLAKVKAHYVEVPEEFRDDLFNVNTLKMYEEQLQKSKERNNITPLTYVELLDEFTGFKDNHHI